MTAPRRAIVRALLAAGGHVTADELAGVVQTSHPDMAVSTVYRTMEVLQEAGLVEHLHLGHGPAVYHLTEHDHRHLVCEDCGRVVEVSEAEFDELARYVRLRLRFTIDGRHVALRGRCEHCAPLH